MIMYYLGCLWYFLKEVIGFLCYFFKEIIGSITDFKSGADL